MREHASPTRRCQARSQVPATKNVQDGLNQLLARVAGEQVFAGHRIHAA